MNQKIMCMNIISISITFAMQQDGPVAWHFTKLVDGTLKRLEEAKEKGDFKKAAEIQAVLDKVFNGEEKDTQAKL